MSDDLNALAAQAAAAEPDAAAYTYAAVDALSARILVVEEGGAALPVGTDIGAPGSDPTGRWSEVLDGAGLEPGMYSWWNAIPYGLERPLTAPEKGRGSRTVKRAVALHSQLYVVVAVGSVTQQVVKAARTNIKVVHTRSPLRSSNAERERIRDTFIEARLYAYPVGFDRG